MTITLGSWINLLEKAEQSKVIRFALKDLHSFRGEYGHLAIASSYDVAVADMLKEAKSVVGKTLPGYKGGEYVMGEHTEIHFALFGSYDEHPEWFVRFVDELFK